MDKVLVEVSVPAARRSFDVFIPQTSKMSEVVSLVSKSLSEYQEENSNQIPQRFCAMQSREKSLISICQFMSLK